GGSDTLNVDDSGDTTANTGALSATAITGLGMGGGIGYANFEGLAVSLGSGGNAFTVAGTASGTATTLDSGTGSDTVNVRATGGLTTVNTGGGSNVNVVNVGSLVPTTGGIVDNVRGTLTVIGNGADTMNVDDTGTTGPKSGVLTATTLTGLGMGAGGITYS